MLSFHIHNMTSIMGWGRNNICGDRLGMGQHMLAWGGDRDNFMRMGWGYKFIPVSVFGRLHTRTGKGNPIRCYIEFSRLCSNIRNDKRDDVLLHHHHDESVHHFSVGLVQRQRQLPWNLVSGRLVRGKHPVDNSSLLLPLFKSGLNSLDFVIIRYNENIKFRKHQAY